MNETIIVILSIAVTVIVAIIAIVIVNQRFTIQVLKKELEGEKQGSLLYDIVLHEFPFHLTNVYEKYQKLNDPNWENFTTEVKRSVTLKILEEKNARQLRKLLLRYSEFFDKTDPEIKKRLYEVFKEKDCQKHVDTILPGWRKEGTPA